MAPGDLGRDELIELVRRIMSCDTDDEAKEDRLVDIALAYQPIELGPVE